jgi:hypothetical protein
MTTTKQINAQLDQESGIWSAPVDPLREFRARLRAAGVKWRRNSAGLLHFYIRTGNPQRMSDGTHWTGTENIGDYESWEQASRCAYLADHAQKEATK